VKRLVLLSILALGCSSSEGPGSEPTAPSCTATEVLLDGACVASGVDTCAEGFASDGQGGCKAILPDAACKGTTIATPGDRACRAVGVTKCAEGFAADDSFQCVAIGGEECGSGLLTVLGSMDCQPVSDCGTTTWGPSPIEPGAIYVDGTYAKGDSDGSVDRPFAELASAIALADSTRKTIVVAEGIYEHGAVLDKPVEIRGRCAERVVVATPKGSSSPVFTVRADVTFRSLTIGGGARGLQIESGTTKVSHANVYKTGGEGIVVANAASAVELEDSIVQSATLAGVFVVGGRATITRSNLRQTNAIALGGGAGLRVQAKGTATVSASVIERNDRFGILAEGSSVTVDRTTVRGNHVVGGGAAAALFSIGGSTTTVTSCAFEGNESIGVYAADGVLTLENSVIASTTAIADIQPTGLWAAVDPYTKKAATVVVRNSAFVGNQGSGLFLAGANVTVDGSLVRDSMPSMDDQSGEGLRALTSDVGKKVPSVTVRDTLIESARHAGVSVTSGKVVLERSVIRDIMPTESGKFGFGVVTFAHDAAARPIVELRSSLLERVHDAGIFAVGAQVTVDGTLVRDLRQRKGDVYGHGIYVSYDATNMQVTNLAVSGSVIDGAFEVGINAFQSNAIVERTTIVNTRAITGYGDGISIAGSQLDGRPWAAASLTVRRSRIAGNARAGVSVFEADASLEGVMLTCNAFPLDVESQSHPANVKDAGGNGCACGAPLDRCTASSANLQAVRPL
jgi:hypothetical protein